MPQCHDNRCYRFNEIKRNSFNSTISTWQSIPLPTSQDVLIISLVHQHERHHIHSILFSPRVIQMNNHISTQYCIWLARWIAISKTNHFYCIGTFLIWRTLQGSRHIKWISRSRWSNLFMCRCIAHFPRCPCMEKARKCANADIGSFSGYGVIYS